MQQIIKSHDLKVHPIFQHTRPITIKVIFSSLKYMQHAKRQPGSFMHLEIRVPCTFLTTTTQKLLKKFLAFLNLHQYEKNQPSSSIHLFIHLVISVPQPFLTAPTPIFFFSTLNFWQQHVKNIQTILSICSRYIFDFKSFNLIDQYQIGPI